MLAHNGETLKKYISFSVEFPSTTRNIKKIIKFPITANCTYAFHRWKTKLKINQDKWAEYRCTWSLYQPMLSQRVKQYKSWANKGRFPRRKCLREILFICSYSELLQWNNGLVSQAQSQTERPARAQWTLNKTTLYWQKRLALTSLTLQITQLQKIHKDCLFFSISGSSA